MRITDVKSPFKLFKDRGERSMFEPIELLIVPTEEWAAVDGINKNEYRHLNNENFCWKYFIYFPAFYIPQIRLFQPQERVRALNIICGWNLFFPLPKHALRMGKNFLWMLNFIDVCRWILFYWYFKSWINI